MNSYVVNLHTQKKKKKALSELGLFSCYQGLQLVLADFITIDQVPLSFSLLENHFCITYCNEIVGNKMQMCLTGC